MQALRAYAMQTGCANLVKGPVSSGLNISVTPGKMIFSGPWLPDFILLLFFAASRCIGHLLSDAFVRSLYRDVGLRGLGRGRCQNSQINS